jgi:hypothetical protein
MVAEIGGMVGRFDDTSGALVLHEGETGRPVAEFCDATRQSHADLAQNVARAVGAGLPMTECRVRAAPGGFRAYVTFSGGDNIVSVQEEHSDERTAVIIAVLLALMDIRCR